MMALRVVGRWVMLGLTGSGALLAPPAHAAEVRVLVPSSAMHAIEGIDIGLDGSIYGTSIHGQAVYRIDPVSGRVSVVVPSPVGESDDVAVGPSGTAAVGILAWTAQRSGEIRILRPGGKPEVILSNAPRVNPIAFNKQGRLFTAQSGAGEDALWELDVIGTKPPRVVAKNKGRLNGFGFGPDGKLYAPYFGTDKLFAIDVDTSAFTVIAEGVGTSAAVKVDKDGLVYSIDYLLGELWRTDVAAKSSKMIARFREPIDNLAIAADGTIYISNVADSAVYAYNPKTGARRDVVRGLFSMTLGMSITKRDSREALIVADPFGYRYVDTVTGDVDRPFWAANRGASSAVAENARSIVYTYAGTNRVRKLDRQTDQLAFESTAVKAPRGIALTSAGDVIVVDAEGGRIVKVTDSGVTDLATGLTKPIGLVLESDTVAWVTEFETGAVKRVDLSTGKTTELAKGLGKPTAVAVMKDGRLAVVESGLGRVSALDAKTGARTDLASGLALSLEGLDLPQDANGGIAVGRDGTIYVSCPGNNSIVAITPGA
ncbi:MAG: hypothetical protein SFV19_14440 [Rhodospirillaceae bacterium]|nr:hypothetical protein [Rhodospirillaceae bacterium]